MSTLTIILGMEWVSFSKELAICWIAKMLSTKDLPARKPFCSGPIRLEMTLLSQLVEILEINLKVVHEAVWEQTKRKIRGSLEKLKRTLFSLIPIFYNLSPPFVLKASLWTCRILCPTNEESEVGVSIGFEWEDPHNFFLRVQYLIQT